ncbi:MAG: chromate efflux transporter [Alphaproteobacteria bacterium]|nr:chromate efflux transporter [Alphaproteobacteria bacterium]
MPIFWVFLRLGLTSFGGPVAHLGYFREEFVNRRRWLDDRAYADIVALCQFLPGPASSQAGAAIGLLRGGLPGLVAAFLGFTLPSALVMGAAAYGLSRGGSIDPGLLGGLKLVAVAVVAHALWGMARTLATGTARASIALGTAIGLMALPALLPGAVLFGQLAAIAGGAVIGAVLLRSEPVEAGVPFSVPVPRLWAVLSLCLFALLLAGLPLLAAEARLPGLSVFDSFYRAGALVFGGGHVVLPLLQAEVTGPGWIGTESFVAGYGVAQAVPGPLFTFATYLGAAGDATGDGRADGAGMAAIATAGIFLPGFLLLIGVLPFWARLRTVRALRAAFAGINAAVVGLLAAALYDPVFTGAVAAPADLAFALGALLALAVWRLPAWLVVSLAAGAGYVLL